MHQTPKIPASVPAPALKPAAVLALAAVLTPLGGCGDTGPRPETVTVEGIAFVRLPAGEFTMGSPEDEAGRRPNETAHRVEIPRPYLLAETEVTNALWTEVMADSVAASRRPDHPRRGISWADAVAFCNALSRNTGRREAYVFDAEANKVVRDVAADGFRLPTEAEWEYACRAGTTTPFHTGDCLGDDQANFRASVAHGDCPTGGFRDDTVPVRSLPPNPWGLYEMSGNVGEWCWDWFAYFTDAATVDRGGPSERQDYKIIRGGTCQDSMDRCRSAARGATVRANRMPWTGLRLVLPDPDVSLED